MKHTGIVLLILAAILALALPALAEPQGLSADSLRVQDFYDYARTDFTINGAGTSPDGAWYRSFSGDPTAIENAVSRYVGDVTGGGWNFALNHESRSEYGEVFYSVTLSYTGSGDVRKGTLPQQFEDDYSGDIMIYYLTNNGQRSAKGYIYVAKGFEVTDLGLRSDGSRADIGPVGPSAGATLVENPDGSFSTSDGRLTAAVGEAAVLRDGELFTTREVSLRRDREENKEKFMIENYYRDEGMAFLFPYNQLMTGDTYGLKTLGQDVFEDGYGTGLDTIFGWRILNAFAIRHQGRYLHAHTDPTESIQNLTVNILLWDTDRGLAVVYVACEIDTSPRLVEALAVFSINAAVSYDGSAERIEMKVGDAVDLSFTDREYMPDYELYMWEILEGSANVELSGNRYQTCRVTATWPGQSRIRVTYSYGAKEFDVLTGIERSAERTITHEYLIEITR